ncbi:RCC1/BLIP-II protein [Saitoella complicata NRRL Y-17804]|uniref:F-box domain-containing protein n=1 Tax=Saitoella complicata (strain BCRC 22490 / CBS 7301 / JCM 7358 / NBRC 10748 / NRRL Y-17804) TaxID=698492 RepID=A0A0E9NJM5_SAICN|nr:RCC1/BLIP-II protein [Saitoella complicata NRRL Y-17804]ODQ55137.1 RCC1/BLIP-II protein [Saitoella complicata NRRL Y-17804]GAO50008.1 hypothetical protein G7K_4143-t1 [Saitoella complicata NRRL Y-17804]
MATIESVASDVLLDQILPLLENADIASLSQTSRAFHTLTDEEILWRRKVQADFNLPPQPARQSGWKELYRGLATARTFTWGSTGNGRLGHSWPGRVGAVSRPKEVREVRGECIVDIVAGGFGFHALTSKGKVYGWGTVGPFGVHERPEARPKRVNFPGYVKTRAISAGRSHMIALDDAGKLWEWHSFKDIDLGTIGFPGLEEKEFVSISAGWGFSAALVRKHGIVVWWEDDTMYDLRADYVTVPGTEDVVAMSAGAGFLVYLTASGDVYRVTTHSESDLLSTPPVHLERFSQPQAAGSAHLSGNFNSFAVFNTATGAVLLGSKDTSTTPDSEPLTPPELQSRGVISVAWGDYHALACCEDGTLLSWGKESQSCGCLGLGPHLEVREKNLEGYQQDADGIKMTKATTVDMPGKVFAVAAGGWHSGALCVMDDEYESENEDHSKILGGTVHVGVRGGIMRPPPVWNPGPVMMPGPVITQLGEGGEMQPVTGEQAPEGHPSHHNLGPLFLRRPRVSGEGFAQDGQGGSEGGEGSSGGLAAEPDNT